MFLVRIDWGRDAWSMPNVVPAANAAANSSRVSHIAIAIARSEPRA